MTLFDIIVDFSLFILKMEPSYYICPSCNNPMLFLIKENNPNNNFINIEEIKFNSSFIKNINLCNKFYDIIIKKNIDKISFDLNKAKEKLQLYKDYLLEDEDIKNKKGYPANPPKIKKFINIIYYDDNYNNELMQLNMELDLLEFKKKTNGVFIFCYSIKTFKEITLKILNENDNQTTFCLISNGKSFSNLIDCININKINFIQKACIYCSFKEKYLPLLNKYEILKGVFTLQKEVIKFIEDNSSSDTEIFESKSKLITYNDYKTKYYILHEEISKYYKKSSIDDFHAFFELFKEMINSSNDYKDYSKAYKKEILDSFLKFENSKNYEEITEYTGDFIYPLINKWLLSLDLATYERYAYVFGHLMFKLNKFGKQFKKNINNEENKILYRGICIDYLNILSYQINLGKIICFQTFLSTSIIKKIAHQFSRLNEIDYKKENSKFSLEMKIEINFSNNLYPLCFDISSISQSPNEKEFLFHPFTFFRLKNYKINYGKNILNLELEAIGKQEILEPGINKGRKLIYDKTQNIIKLEEPLQDSEEPECLKCIIL